MAETLKEEIPQSPQGNRDEKKRTSDKYLQNFDLGTLIRRASELESENQSLRERIWRLQYRGTFPLSLGFISAGSVLLFFSYMYSTMILTFVGLGLAVWGALIFYASPSRYVPEHLVNSSSLSMIKSLDSIVAGMGYRGRTIFLHPRYLKGLAQGYVFIPYEGVRLPSDEQQAKEKLFYDEPKGIFVVAPSQGLVEIFEQELNTNFAMVDLEYIQEKLPKLLIEDLKMLDKISIESDEKMIRVEIIGESCARLCDMIGRETNLGDHLGCPICSALALIASKVSGRPVTIKDNFVTNNKIKTTYEILDL